MSSSPEIIGPAFSLSLSLLSIFLPPPSPRVGLAELRTGEWWLLMEGPLRSVPVWSNSDKNSLFVATSDKYLTSPPPPPPPPPPTHLSDIVAGGLCSATSAYDVVGRPQTRILTWLRCPTNS